MQVINDHSPQNVRPFCRTIHMNVSMNQECVSVLFLAALIASIAFGSVSRTIHCMRYHVLLLAACFTLAACGDGGGGTNIACKTDYWDGTYGTCLPDHWMVIDGETLRQRGVPTDTIVAFQSDVPVSGQFPTVTVTREPLRKAVSAKDYSSASVRAVTVLPGYEEIDTRETTIAGEDVHMHIFKAQPAEGETLRRFFQVSTVANGVGYSVTATTPVSLDAALENQVTLILRESIFEEAGAEQK